MWCCFLTVHVCYSGETETAVPLDVFCMSVEPSWLMCLLLVGFVDSQRSAMCLGTSTIILNFIIIRFHPWTTLCLTWTSAFANQVWTPVVSCFICTRWNVLPVTCHVYINTGSWSCSECETVLVFKWSHQVTASRESRKWGTLNQAPVTKPSVTENTNDGVG